MSFRKLDPESFIYQSKMYNVIMFCSQLLVCRKFKF